MTNLTGRLLLALSLTGCVAAHGPDPMRVADDVELPATPEAPRCALGLEPVGTIDNDDIVEHGDVISLGVSPEGRIAVSTEDGAIKLWTLEGFEAALGVREVLYGAETEAGPRVLDLAFWGDRVVAADEGGLVSGWTADGGFRILGGVEPDVALRAVAIDAAHGRVAHADERDGGHVMVRGLEDATTIGPLETGLHAVNDLAFLPDGRLAVGGGDHIGEVVLFDADTPSLRLPGVVPALPEPVTQIAVSSGGRLVAIAERGIVVYDLSAEDSAWAWMRTEPVTRVSFDGRHSEPLGDHAPVGVAILGDAALTIGAEGAIVAWSLADGSELARADVPDPVAVGADPSTGTIVVASRDGLLHLFGCTR